jgi:TRAP-type C4-dicarboxylate transport system permease small subunit
MKFFHNIDSVLTRVVNAALVLLFSVMLSLAVIQVFLRYFFNSSILWGDIAARTLVLWVGFLGAALATKENKHFHIDVLTRFLKKRYQLWFQSFSNLFASVICFFLGQASVTFLELDNQTKTFLQLPVFVVELIIPIGFYLMMIQFALRMIINANDGLHTSPVSDQAEGEK